MSSMNKKVLLCNLQHIKLPQAIDVHYLIEVISCTDNFNQFGHIFYDSCINSIDERYKWKALLERLYEIHHSSIVCASIPVYINAFLVLLNPYIIAVNEFTTERVQQELLDEAYKIINN